MNRKILLVNLCLCLVFTCCDLAKNKEEYKMYVYAVNKYEYFCRSGINTSAYPMLSVLIKREPMKGWVMEDINDLRGNFSRYCKRNGMMEDVCIDYMVDNWNGGGRFIGNSVATYLSILTNVNNQMKAIKCEDDEGLDKWGWVNMKKGDDDGDYYRVLGIMANVKSMNKKQQKSGLKIKWKIRNRGVQGELRQYLKGKVVVKC